jgi:hypothetical protein
MRLAVGTPWASPFVWTRWADAMLNLERPGAIRNALGQLEPSEVRFFRGVGWCPARRHASICEKALEWGADLICIVGADQIHPEDMLPRLVARWNEGYEVIAALVPARGFVGWQEMLPFQRMAWRLKTAGAAPSVSLETLNAANGVPAAVDVVDPAAGDVQPINFIGSGVLMFHRDHLLALPKPWFSETFNPETMERLASMDTTFVWRLQTEAGAQVWVDTTIKVRHLHAFEIDETYPERFKDWTQPGAGDPTICVHQRPAMAG